MNRKVLRLGRASMLGQRQRVILRNQVKISGSQSLRQFPLQDNKNHLFWSLHLGLGRLTPFILNVVICIYDWLTFVFVFFWGGRMGNHNFFTPE